VREELGLRVDLGEPVEVVRLPLAEEETRRPQL
jgi:hypothetical protein